jgi:hypothetical protein
MGKRNLMKKTFAFFIVIIVAASFIAGCQPEASPQANAPVPKTPVKIKKLNGGFTDPS